jgi:hypothetical protein
MPRGSKSKAHTLEINGILRTERLNAAAVADALWSAGWAPRFGRGMKFALINAHNHWHGDHRPLLWRCQRSRAPARMKNHAQAGDGVVAARLATLMLATATRLSFERRPTGAGGGRERLRCQAVQCE